MKVIHANTIEGARPICGQRGRGIPCVTIDRFRIQHVKCQRCLAKVEKHDRMAIRNARRSIVKYIYEMRPDMHWPVFPNEFPPDLWDFDGERRIWIYRPLTEWECDRFKLIPVNTTPRGTDRDEFVAKIARYTREQLRVEFNQCGEAGNEEENHERRRDLQETCRIIDAIAQYRFPDCWIEFRDLNDEELIEYLRENGE